MKYLFGYIARKEIEALFFLSIIRKYKDNYFEN